MRWDFCNERQRIQETEPERLTAWDWRKSVTQGGFCVLFAWLGARGEEAKRCSECGAGGELVGSGGLRALDTRSGVKPNLTTNHPRTAVVG